MLFHLMDTDDDNRFPSSERLDKKEVDIQVPYNSCKSSRQKEKSTYKVSNSCWKLNSPRASPSGRSFGACAVAVDQQVGFPLHPRLPKKTFTLKVDLVIRCSFFGLIAHVEEQPPL